MKNKNLCIDTEKVTRSAANSYISFQLNPVISEYLGNDSQGINSIIYTTIDVILSKALLDDYMRKLQYFSSIHVIFTNSVLRNEMK